MESLRTWSHAVQHWEISAESGRRLRAETLPLNSGVWFFWRVANRIPNPKHTPKYTKAKVPRTQDKHTSAEQLRCHYPLKSLAAASLLRVCCHTLTTDWLTQHFGAKLSCAENPWLLLFKKMLFGCLFSGFNTSLIPPWCADVPLVKLLDPRSRSDLGIQRPMARSGIITAWAWAVNSAVSSKIASLRLGFSCFLNARKKEDYCSDR